LKITVFLNLIAINYSFGRNKKRLWVIKSRAFSFQATTSLKTLVSTAMHWTSSLLRLFMIESIMPLQRSGVLSMGIVLISILHNLIRINLKNIDNNCFPNKYYQMVIKYFWQSDIYH
jgi:hypothetical protein